MDRCGCPTAATRTIKRAGGGSGTAGVLDPEAESETSAMNLPKGPGRHYWRFGFSRLNGLRLLSSGETIEMANLLGTGTVCDKASME